LTRHRRPSGGPPGAARTRRTSRGGRRLEQQPEATAQRAPLRVSNDGGWLFATPTGGALNPRTDYDDWKKLLVKAGVREAGCTIPGTRAATVLLLLGVPERALMGSMGWSHTAMAARYQHVTGAIQRDVADRVGGLIWQVEDPSRKGN
jgi:integrase